MASGTNTLTALLIHACLAPLVLAASSDVVSIQGNAMSQGGAAGGGILGLLVLFIDVFVFFEVFQSSRPPAQKAIWTLGVFFFPVLGAILYYLFSEREKHKPGSGYQEIV